MGINEINVRLFFLPFVSESALLNIKLIIGLLPNRGQYGIVLVNRMVSNLIQVV